MHCVCGKQHKAGYAAKKIDGKANYDFWVCGNCNLPSRMLFEGLIMGYMPRRATSILSHVDHGNGTATNTWATEVSGERIQTASFHPYPRKVNMDQGRNIVVELWHRLDQAIDQIRGGQVDVQLLELEKIRAMTLAETIVLVMPHFYAETNLVLAESMERWKARQAGEVRDTSGLAESEWVVTAPTPVVSIPVAQVFDEQKTNFIKHSISTGVMDAKTLAGMFKCSEADIKAAYDS